VVLTAAHCVPTSGDVTFQFPGRDVPYALTCTAHPDYVKETDVSADYALCVTKTPLVAPSGFLYETVNTSSSTMQELLRNQATIILSGYGCISDIVANDDIDEKYRIGFNSLDEISTSPTRRRGAEYYSPRQVNNLFTKADPNKANLCPGDSGGPAFRRTGGTDQFSRRVIVGVNSRVFFTDESETRYGSSMISATGGPAFRGWAEQWAIEAGVAACGLHGAVPNCRT
jgi:hypothetical protein